MNLGIDKLNLDSSKPLYMQLTEILEKKIRDREIKVGDKLPPEQEMMAAYNVSIDTMRGALTNLVKAGYLSRRRRYGTLRRSLFRPRSYRIATARR